MLLKENDMLKRKTKILFTEKLCSTQFYVKSSVYELRQASAHSADFTLKHLLCFSESKQSGEQREEICRLILSPCCALYW